MKKDDSVLVTLNEDGVAEVYDDTYDITIHCKTEEDQKKVCENLKRCHGWIPVEERLPENNDYVLMSLRIFLSRWLGDMRATRMVREPGIWEIVTRNIHV